MDFETITFEKQDGLAVLTLNRPSVLNALNNHLITEMRTALRESENNPDIRVLIITGAGRGFCAGADLNSDDIPGFSEKSHLSVGDIVAELMAEYHNPLIMDITRLRKPVISAVNGITAGAGNGLALAGDIVIAARSASFKLVFGPQLGIIPDMGCTWFLPRLIGRARTLGMTLTGDKLPAETAAEWGLIWKCVDDDKLMDEARKVGRKLADGPPRVYTYMKQAFMQSEKNSLPEQLELEKEFQRILCGTEDFKEGVSAFLEKRKPEFKGK
jgi:2-(1,2-epoxy-1,2-dihydrophenyl)acetyl-CoA isomerase